MKKIKDDVFNGRRCEVYELPYSKDKIWIVERIKGGDYRKIEGINHDLDALPVLIRQAMRKKELVKVDSKYIDDMDMADIRAISEHTTVMLDVLDKSVEKNKETKKN